MSADLDKTLWVGNLSDRVTDDILYEFFLQAGPLKKVSIAKEKDGRQKSFAFITFAHDVSVPYTINLMDGMQLYGRNLRLQSRPGSIHQQQQQQQQQQQMGLQQQSQPGMAPQQQQHQQSRYQNTGNPYQNNQAPYNPNSPAPYNPYGTNRPARNQPQPPNLNRSNTWHGNDLDQLNRDRDGRESRDRDKFSNRDRDRSGSRRREVDSSGRYEEYDRSYSRDDQRQGGSSSGMKSFGSDDLMAKRQRVLHKQDQMLSRYKQAEGSSSPQHQSWQQKGYNNRRGRY